MYTKTEEKDRQKTQNEIILEKSVLRNEIASNVIAHIAIIIEEIQLLYEPNVQNALL